MGNLISIKKSDMRFFDAAKKEAEKSTFPRFHVGCVMVYNGHVISAACNSEKTDTLQKKYNRYRNFNNQHTHKCVLDKMHAEIKALKQIPYPVAQQIDWKKVKVFTVRIAPGLPTGFGNSRPCRACLTALRERGIREFYYTTDMGICGERIV